MKKNFQIILISNLKIKRYTFSKNYVFMNIFVLGIIMLELKTNEKHSKSQQDEEEGLMKSKTNLERGKFRTHSYQSQTQVLKNE
jgi:hypothetical protein